MKIIRILFNRELLLLTLTLMLNSGVVVGLVIGRMAFTGSTDYAFLVWNLFLAWLPLIFALLARERFRVIGRVDWRLGTLAGLWLLFFPNAPYIFTDLVHLTHGAPHLFWVDMMLVLIGAFTGLVLGFVSLQQMQSIVAQWRGRPTSWLFVTAVCGLGALGVNLGRFARLNSWDAALAPVAVLHHVGATVQGMLTQPHSAIFTLMFSIFLFLAYAMLHALTRQPLATATDQGFPH